MKKVKNLVLGGAGMIGGHLCKYLESIGEEVISLDIKTGFDLREDDLSIYKDADYVWFLAWDVGGAKYLTSQENLLNIMKNNIRICERTFAFLEEYKIPFMFASSQLAEPDNTYGITKIAGEEWARLLGGKIVKFWNVYGWEEPGEKSHVIPDIVTQALTHKKISLMTTGVEERQFIYAADCVRNLHLIKDLEGQYFDLTTGHWSSIVTIAEQIAEKLDATVEVGDVKGYHNKVEPEMMHKDFDIQYDLSSGIDEVIEHAKKYLTQTA